MVREHLAVGGSDSRRKHRHLRRTRQFHMFNINGIMHGDTREEINANIQKQTPDFFKISKAADFIGHRAYAALFNSFGIKQSQIDNMVSARRTLL
jgi:hypothetical protein